MMALLGTSALLVVTGALLVVTKKLVVTNMMAIPPESHSESFSPVLRFRSCSFAG